MTNTELIAFVGIGVPILAKILDIASQKWEKKHDWFIQANQMLDNKRKELEGITDKKLESALAEIDELKRRNEEIRQKLIKALSIIREFIDTGKITREQDEFLHSLRSYE